MGKHDPEAVVAAMAREIASQNAELRAAVRAWGGDADTFRSVTEFAPVRRSPATAFVGAIRA